MATTHSTIPKIPEDNLIGASAPDDPATPQDQHLIVRTLADMHAEYIGTRAMLEAEGILPKDTDWPQEDSVLHWRNGRFNYFLSRTRPAGAKGPRRQFLDCDWWSLRWELPNRLSHFDCEIKRKEKELRDYIFQHTVEGHTKWLAEFDRYLKATKDAKFQAFKAAIPGLVKSKRGHRFKSAD